MWFSDGLNVIFFENWLYNNYLSTKSWEVLQIDPWDWRNGWKVYNISSVYRCEIRGL